MAVIALRGRSGVGKTPTLNLLHQQLPQHGYSAVPGFYQNLTNNDFLDLLEERNTRKKLGIVSRGDYPNLLQQDIDYLFNAGAIVVVCACRVWGATTDVIRTYQPYHLERKSASSNIAQHLALNQQDVGILMQRIQLYIP